MGGKVDMAGRRIEGDMCMPGMMALSCNGYNELDQYVDGVTAARNENRGRGSATKTVEVVIYDVNASNGATKIMPA